MMSSNCWSGLCLVYLQFLAIVIIGHCDGANDNKCQLQILSMESSPEPLLVDPVLLYKPKSRVEFIFTLESTCRPSIDYEFLDPGSGKWYNLNSMFIVKNRGLNFEYHFDGSPPGKNAYRTSFTIKPITRSYGGTYRFILKDSSDFNNNDTYNFTINVELSEPEVYNKPCFLPRVYDIIAIPRYSTGSSNTLESITVRWETTVKESDISYCNNSRRWKIRFLKYSNFDETPGDKVVDTSQSPSWSKVPGRRTNYTFIATDDLPLTLSDFYSFQVEHLGKNFKEDIEPITFASVIHFFGEQQTPSIQKLSAADSVITLQVGASWSMHCKATGFPPPKINWIGQSPNNDSTLLELNHVTLEDAGDYHCLAYNFFMEPPNEQSERTDYWKITIIVEDYDESETGLSCHPLPMDSSVCKTYVHSDRLKIFTDHRNNESSMEREARATNMMTEIDYFIPLGTCRDLAYSMLCHHVYPYCDVLPGLPTPRKLCSQVCEEFRSGRCSGYLTRNDSVYDMLVEGCDDRQYTGGESPECIPLSYNAHKNHQVELIKDTGNCVRGDGRGYSGNQYLTESGALCQAWSTQSPHPHPMLPELYTSDLEQAHLSCRNPGGIGNRPWCYTNDPNVRWEYCDIPKCDSCEVYKGETCRSLEGYSNDSSVFVTRTKFLQSQGAIEHKLSLFWRSVSLLKPSEGCKEILQVLLCHGTFPQCSREQQSKQLCSIYCQFNHTLHTLCPSLYTEFKNFIDINKEIMTEPTCWMDSNEEECMSVPMMSEDQDQQDNSNDNMKDTNMKGDCYEGNGWSYNGNMSVTQNGVPCQYWDSQVPHSHSITTASYPELESSLNHCRNPDNLKERPWCFTTDTNTVWDYCNVQKCKLSEDKKNGIGEGDSNGNNALPNGQSRGGSSSIPIIITMSVCVVILVVLMVLAFAGCMLFQKRRSHRAKAILESEFRLSKMTCEAFKGEKYITNADYTQVSSMATKQRSQSLVVPENFKLLDSKNIKYVSQLGQGNFGIVFKGKAFGLKDEAAEEDEGIEVAVKTLKEEASSEVKQDFIDEAKLMFTFDHPNILKIHGVCMSEMPYQLVFEYMDEGDLTKFLRSRASSHQRRLINPFSYRSRTESCYSDDPASLSKTELLYICKQIASGMKYLSEKKHVHRDLACRNCLIKSDLVVKIGDFGMSRNLYSKDYYRINGKAVLPVRWMSPESLVYGKFSIEGDVWSYGVVMWEVFSFALQPYYGITNEEVTEAIRKGKTLNRPDDCPSEVYRLMKECWSMDPSDRISFPELYESLSTLHQLASLCGSSVGEKFTDDEDDAFSDSSDMPSDAFYSEEHLDSV